MLNDLLTTLLLKIEVIIIYLLKAAKREAKLKDDKN